MTEVEFRALAQQGYNRIPLTVEAFADLDTPLSLYLKLANEPFTYLLESVVGGERFGRYSFIGLPARTLLRVRGDRVEVETNGDVVETFEGNPLDFIARYQERFKVAPQLGLPRFAAAWPATSATTPYATSSPGWPASPSPIPSACPTSC